MSSSFLAMSNSCWKTICHENGDVELLEYENERLRNQSFTRNGKLEGPFRRWYNDGTLLKCGWYRDGMLDGEYRSWYPNGQLIMRAFYRSGNMQGKCKYWYLDGKIMSESYWIDGKATGEHKLWDHVGVLERYEFWRNGYSITTFFNLKMKLEILKLKRHYCKRPIIPDTYIILDLS